MTNEEYRIKMELVRDYFQGSLMLMGKAVASLRHNYGRPLSLEEAVEILYQQIENNNVTL